MKAKGLPDLALQSVALNRTRYLAFSNRQSQSCISRIVNSGVNGKPTIQQRLFLQKPGKTFLARNSKTPGKMKVLPCFRHQDGFCPWLDERRLLHDRLWSSCERENHGYVFFWLRMAEMCASWLNPIFMVLKSAQLQSFAILLSSLIYIVDNFVWGLYN